MSLSYSQRMTDPRWQKAGELFAVTFEVKGDLATANPHAYVNIRLICSPVTGSRFPPGMCASGHRRYHRHEVLDYGPAPAASRVGSSVLSHGRRGRD